jgi:hypothetical protein
MGLKEYLQAGASLTRDNIEILTDVAGSGSVDLGSAYVLYAIQSNTSCRLRLYDNLDSLNNLTEQSRAFGDTNIPASISLIGDFTMAAGTYTIDPALYGVVGTPSTKLTYYKIDNAPSVPRLTFGRYLLEDSVISTDSRVELPSIQVSLSPGQLASGSVTNADIPRTYLFVSASVSNTSAPIRVRFYNTQPILNNTTEKNRPYASETQTNTLLLDAILTGSETTYFVPKIIGANIQNMGTDLNIIKNSFSTLAGKHEIYYMIENLASVGSSQSVTASVHVFSLET